MPKYHVNLQTVASMSVTVEAEDEKSAIDAAYEEIPSGVCAQCSGWDQFWSLDLGEFELIDQTRGYDPKYDGPVVELIGDDEE